MSFKIEQTLRPLWIVGLLSLGILSSHTFAQESKQGSQRLEIFKDNLPSGEWAGGKDFGRDGGPDGSKRYIYMNPSNSPVRVEGLSIPIRQKPGPGEYRYITFRWIKWGGNKIGIHLIPKPGAGESPEGKKMNFTYIQGQPDSTFYGLQLSDKVTGNWETVTRDLWKDFGNFTLTGVEFICPESRDAGFDNIILGQTDKVFEDSPGVLPSKVADPVEVKGEDLSLDDLGSLETDAAKEAGKGGSIKSNIVEANVGSPDENALAIDWNQQLRAGGVWMYPIYVLGFYGIVVTILRLILSRRGRLAPRKLRKKVRLALSENRIDEAIEACEASRSTLADSLKYIFEHRNAERDVVSQVSGDMAGREIREQLDKIYPLSVVSSLAPLLGLLGTIVGMIEAFGLVALYGDEGGPSLLSDSISKALITTAAGLIIAIPAIAIYFYLKRSIKSSATIMEEELEYALTMVYLKKEGNYISEKPELEDNTVSFSNSTDSKQ